MSATKEVAARRKTLPELLNDDATQKRFESMLGKDARSFQQNILTVYNGSKSLQDCDPESIIAACAISASINLSILPSLGQSCVVPYKDGDRLVAQWQIMWKGVVQLAQRSERYAKINLARVYEGQLVKHDEFKGEVTLDATKKKSGRIMGYYFYFKLNDGYTFEDYWSAKKCIEHGLRYSKSFQKGSGKWAEDAEFSKTVKAWLAAKEQFLTEGTGADAMSAKTLVKNDLLKWGPLETRIKETIALDQAVIGTDGKPRYIDTTAESATETKTYVAPPMTEKGKDADAEKVAWFREHTIKLGATAEGFDAWAAQYADDKARVEAGKAAWALVTKKELTAAAAFAVTPKEAVVEGKIVEPEARFKVKSIATVDLNGDNDYFVIKDVADEPTKYFTKHPAIVAAAEEAKKADAEFAVTYAVEKSGKQTVRIITDIIA